MITKGPLNFSATEMQSNPSSRCLQLELQRQSVSEN